MSNATHLPGPQAWLNFRRIVCSRWDYRNLILLGDAAHTAHFSIGSGTKLALEDAIKLAEVLNRPGLTREAALAEYQAERNLEVLKLQNSRPQFDRMVRDPRPLSAFRADPVRLFAAHPLAAGQPRKSAAARPRLAGRASSAGSSRRRRAGR